MNIEWAQTELRSFIDMTVMNNLSTSGDGFSYITTQMGTKAPDSQVMEAAAVVEQILDVVLPDWRASVPSDGNEDNRWSQHREAAIRAEALLARREEVEAMLGDQAPRMSAGSFHPWVWEAARSLWKSGHYRQALAAAAVRINHETRVKVNRTDVSEVSLFQNVFNSDAPQPGKPRLRLADDDGSNTYRSLHRGVAAIAEGLYAAIRNPISHEYDLPELTEDEALEQLGMFSYLARRVDEAKVDA